MFNLCPRYSQYLQKLSKPESVLAYLRDMPNFWKPLGNKNTFSSLESGTLENFLTIKEIVKLNHKKPLETIYTSDSFIQVKYNHWYKYDTWG